MARSRLGVAVVRGRLTAPRRRAARRAALACSALLAGCLQLAETIAIGPDGSGTQQVVMTMPERTLVEARRAAAVNQTAAADPQALFVRDTVQKELTAAGLELVSHETKSLDGARRVALLAKFASPQQLRASPLSGTTATWEFAPGPAPGTVEVTLYPQGKAAWTEARAKAEAMKNEVDAVAADFFDKRKAQLAGLDVTLRFKLPGKVLRLTRNLDQTADDEVTARITADRIRTAEDLVRWLAPRFQVVFDASGCPAFPIDR
jgi:hypothetical protein